jgi:tRNA-2-methylthio-N6-dimethylallyladenosine synthase
MNVSDSERVASNLRANGFELTEVADAADVILLNTCSIREKAEQKVFRRVSEIKRERVGRQPLVGVLGCVAQLEGESIFNRSPSVQIVAGTGATDRIPSLLERASEGERHVIDLDEREEGTPFEISPTVRHSRHIAYVPIIEGCNKFCTYCIVPYSRGRERSRPASEIVEEVRRLCADGFKEVQLIGQNVNSYRPKVEKGLEGFAGATPFSRLLRAVASTEVPRVKFTTSFPRDFHADIVKAIEECENLCNWVHLPVQSGNNRVLKAMRRGHRVEEYLERVSAVKNSRSEISLTSDIIVGFPGETDVEFRDTLRLVEECEFHGLYIFKYSERRGTPAAKLSDSVATETKTQRFLELEELQMSIQSRIYRTYVGKVVEVLAEGFSARSGSDLTGHTACHKVVNFGGSAELIGNVLKVRVTEAKAHSLFGQIV